MRRSVQLVCLAGVLLACYGVSNMQMCGTDSSLSMWAMNQCM